MGQHQDEVFTGGVGDAEGHLVVVKFAEIRVQFHVFRKSCIQPIFHLKVKPRPPSSGLPVTSAMRWIPQRSRLRWPVWATLFKWRKNSMASSFYFPPYLVGDPVPRCASVVQIQHGGHGVHPPHGNSPPSRRALAIRKLAPRFPVIKDRSPVGMLAFSWICVLIKACPVKICQAMGVLWKMGRNPV